MAPKKKKRSWGGRRKGAGPKPKPEGEQLTHDLRARVRADEHAAANAAAEQAGLSTAEFVRRAVTEKVNGFVGLRKST